MARVDQRYVTLGPFGNGMNSYSDEAAIRDDELVDIINFEIDVDDSLRCRPPIVALSDAPGGERHYFIMSFILNGNTRILTSTADGGAYSYNPANDTYTLIRANLYSFAAVQYAEKIWIVPNHSSSSNGGSWDGTTFTEIAAIPKGEACLMYNERMWVAPGRNAGANSSRLFFSAIANPATWNVGTDFFDCSPGDGQKLVDLLVLNNNLVAFKEDSTYVYTYDSSPTNAIRTKISNTIGATGLSCVVVSDDEVYVYHEGEVFQLIDYNYEQINIRVPFEYDATTPVWSTRYENICLSVIGERLVVRYFNRIYVFNTNSRTWSRWQSQEEACHNIGRVIALPSDVQQRVNDAYYAGSSLRYGRRALRIYDGFDPTTKEGIPSTPVFVDILCYIKTKNYSFDIPYRFKKLYWWGCEALTSREVTGTAIPVTFSFNVTWSSIATRAINTLLTWDQPTIDGRISTTIAGTVGTFRRYFKFLKAMRFRQIYFEVTLKGDGTTLDGPAKLYSIIAVARPAQVTVKAVS